MEIQELSIYKLAEVANLYKTAFEKELKKMNLHSGQVFVLRELFETDGQSQIDLAKKLNLSPPTIYKMVKSLTKSQFVNCRKCATDGRMMRVYLSEKALELESSIRAKWAEFNEFFFSSLTETEKLILSQILDKIKSGHLTVD